MKSIFSKYLFVTTLITTIIVISTSGFFATPAQAAPLLANYFLSWKITDSDATQLAKWNLIVLDMETQSVSRDQILKIRALNPKIKILAYVTSQEIRDDAANGYSIMRRKLASGVKEAWYLNKSDGTPYSFWSGTRMLNVTDYCPSVDGKKWNQYLANFMAAEVLSSGLWDGVFYDNVWESMSWFTGPNVDLNGDGSGEGGVDERWRAGFKELFGETRRLAGARYIIVGNGVSLSYYNDFNGNLIENLPQMNWTDSMRSYAINSRTSGLSPRVVIINSNSGNTGNNVNYQAMRYGLASTLLNNGYYSFDHGDQNHGQTWWYDEYAVNLGEPVGAAASNFGDVNYMPGVWRRNFTNGVSVVNSGNSAATVDLGGDYEKIIGTQDKAVNSGLIVDKVNLAAKDGIILLKTAQSLKNTVFVNGYFARFYNYKGARARNGFFLSADGEPGGAQVYLGDLNGDGTEDKISAARGHLKIENSDGGIWYNDYPFGANYTGDVRVAVGTLMGTAEKDIVLSPGKGSNLIEMNYFGQVMSVTLMPAGKKFKGGFYISIANTDGGIHSETIVGIGAGSAGEILVYDWKLSKIRRRFFPYGKTFVGGIKLAAGDVDGDGKAEIITLASIGGKQLARVFKVDGKKMSEFVVPVAFGVKEYLLTALDVNFDNRDEIVVMNN